jgi:CubicO group peptidase (beta-lactamase class C family)
VKPARVPLGMIVVVAALITGCTADEVTPSPSDASGPAQSTGPGSLAPSDAASTSTSSTPATGAQAHGTESTVTIAAAAPYDKVPEQTNDGWQTASLADVGIDARPIVEMLDSIYAGDGRGPHNWPPGHEKYENIHGVLIVKDGKLVFEEYFYGYRLDSRHNLASVTKSITSMLAGIAIDRGDVGSIEDEILPYFPEFLPPDRADDQLESITIEDLLTMRHGWECDDWDPDSRTYYPNGWELSQPDAVEATLDLPSVTPPGSRFSYCSASSIVLGGLIANATGTSIPDYAHEVLFSPLGIETALWSAAPGGWTDTGGSLQMRPRDMARLGQLMLQGGNWNGIQVLPEDWVRQSVQQQVRLTFNDTWGRGYGFLWWLSETPFAGGVVGSFAASGAGGQVIVVFPDLDMVVVITGGNYQDDHGQPFEIMDRFILPAVLGH